MDEAAAHKSCMLWLPDLPGRIPAADVPSHKRSLNSALGGLEGGQAAASTLYDDVDQYGQRTLRSRTSSVLALRATCHTLRLAVDTIVRMPPLDFVPRLQAWLVANLGAPPLQLTDNSSSSEFDWAARLVSSSAHAELQQLRLGEVLARTCQSWKGKNASAKLAELQQRLLLSYSSSSTAATGDEILQTPRLKVVHFDHHSDFIGSDGGQTIESVLSLLLPGQPGDLVELVLICDYCQSEEGPSTALGVDLRIDSQKWSRLPDMGELPTGVPLIRYDGDYEGDKDLLLRLWSSLGFSVPQESRIVESDSCRGAAWRTEKIAAVLLACLGFKFETNLEGISTDSVEGNLLGARLRGKGSARARDLIKRRQQSAALLASWEHMLDHDVRPCLSSLGQAQRSVVWELVARTVERTIGQIRLSSRIGAAMVYYQSLLDDTLGESSRVLALAPFKVLDSLVVLGCHSVEVLSEHVEISGYTSSCVRLLCRFPLATDRPMAATLLKVSSGHLIFRCEHNRGTSVHDLEGLLRITVEAVGEELQQALRDADWSEDEATTISTTHVLLTVAVDIPGRPEDAEDIREVATEKLALVGRLLGMTARPATEKRPHHEEESEFAKGVARLLLFASNLTIWGLSACFSKIHCGLLWS